MSAAGSWIEVDRSALRHNVRMIRQVVGHQVEILVPVKADGYGHGASEIATCVLDAGADRVGVARIQEGVALREAGISAPLHVLEPFHADDLPDYLAHDLIPTLCDEAAAQALSQAGVERGTPLRAHLKLNTGMSRLGLHAVRDRALIARLLRLPGIDWEGVFTHFARADEESSHTATQLQTLQGTLDWLREQGLCPRVAHAANSAGLFLHPQSHLDMVRPGLAVYGYDPTGGLLPAGVTLRPALRLFSTVRHLTWVEVGEEVSYGGLWQAARRSRIAAIPLGYGDGFWRSHSGRIQVSVNGILCPQVGRICMDILMLDVTEVPSVQLGDRVIVIAGEENPLLSAERLARNQGTIVYEVTCDLGRRLERRFVH